MTRPRRSLLERLERDEAVLERAADRVLGHEAPQLGQLHRNTLALLDGMLAQVARAEGQASSMTRMLAGLLQRARPELNESIARIPERDLHRFLVTLQAQIAACLNVRAMPTEDAPVLPAMTESQARAAGAIDGPLGLQTTPNGQPSAAELGHGTVAGYDERLQGVTLPAVIVGTDDDETDEDAHDSDEAPA